MTSAIIWVIVLLVTALGFFLLGRRSKESLSLNQKPEDSADYWRGRGEGWGACEDMVIERAETNPHYNREKVLEDLLQ